MRVDLDDVLDEAGVAEHLGLSQLTVRRYRQRRDWITPVRVYGRTPVYLRQDVDAWMTSRPLVQGGLGEPRPMRRKR